MSESQDGDQEPVKSPPATETTIQIDDSKAVSLYANFCRVASTPEEVILDLGLNPHPPGTPRVQVQVAQRIIVNHFTAKRLLSALSYAVQQHERVFGPLELDVRKRAGRRAVEGPAGKARGAAGRPNQPPAPPEE